MNLTTRRLAPLVLTVLCFGMACLSGARPPNVDPRGTLSPGEGEAALQKPEGPFGVAFASPRGQTVDPSEISIVWNRPMRPLELAGEESTPPISIKPPVRGRWGWVGTSGVVFVPETALPHATEITVEVPAGTRALDGAVMDKGYVVRFSTARPKLEYVDADPGNRNDLTPASRFTLRFNQPVSDQEIARAVTLSAGDKAAPVAFEIKRKDPQNQALAEIVPKTPLPLDSQVHVTAADDLHGTEGPLPSGALTSFDFRTYGPLEVLGVDCSRDTPNGKCSTDGGVSIALTNPVPMKDLKAAFKIDPPVKVRWPSWLDDDSRTSRLYIGARFAPGRVYHVSINNGGLRDVFGQGLKKAFRKPVAFDDYWPQVEISLTGSLFEAPAKRPIPIATVNVREMQVATAPLDEALVLKLEGNHRAPTAAEIGAFSGAKVDHVKPGGAANKPVNHLIKPDVVLGKDKKGPLAIGVSFTDRPGTRWARTVNKAAIMQFTDLAISAKVSPRGSLVWVTKLGTATPVAGAEVRVMRPGQQSAPSFKTDASGFAEIPEGAFKPVSDGPEHGVIFVRSGDDWTYRPVSDTLSGYRIGASHDLGPDRPIGLVFTDRGIYRPGDTAHIKVIFREEAPRGTATPSGKPVEVTIAGPDGEAISKQSHTLGAFGTVSADVKVPDTGRLGTYSIQVSVPGSPRGYADATGDFEVAEYRAAEFKVSVESDKPTYVRGDKASWSARGDYLFGAPMAGAEAWFNVSRTETWFSPPLPEGFGSSDLTYWSGKPEASERGHDVHNAETKLDDKGLAVAGTALSMPAQRGAESITCEARVTDLSRQAISSSTTAIVHPGEFYIGLKGGSDLFVKGGDTLKPEVLAVEPKGARVAGVAIAVELIQRRWTVARQQVGGGFRTVSNIEDQTVGSCQVTSADKPGSCELRVPSVGYYIVRASAKDKRGNPVGASSGVYATGDTGEVSWGDNDKTELELVPNKKSYEVGDTARILVKSPFKSAEALVTVERSGVYTRHKITLAGPTPTIQVPITEDLRPNAFVSVLLVRPRSKPAPAKPGAADVGAPSFRAGYTQLSINPEARRLAVTLKASKNELRPGDNVEIDLDVKDKLGKPARAEITLYAVDEGVLSLIGYKTPDPIPVFGAPRPLKVATIEAREVLAQITNPLGALGLDKGLEGGDGGGGSIRRDFRASAYYNPSLLTDASGHAKASFKLPDGLTTYRVMAVVAAEDDRFGFAEDRLVTSRPLMARPALPRFIRAGDQIDAGVIVTVKGLQKPSVEVSVAAEGLEIKGDSKRTVTLGDTNSTEVRFVMDAPKVGKAKLRFTAKGAGHEDTVEVVRDVKVPAVLEAVALYGDTTKAAADKLGDLSSMRDDVGGLEVSMASTALVGLAGGMEQLIEYPYGCTEQLTSRLVPLLPLRDLANDYKVKLPADVDRAIPKTIATILSHQRGDGGFGLWAESPDASPFVTAYALWGLHVAKKHGAEVPDHAMESATKYLRSHMKLVDEPVALASMPFVLDVLAEVGSPDAGRASDVFEKRDKIPLFGKAQLLHAMAIGKSDPSLVEKLFSEVEGQLRVDADEARAVSNHGNRYAVLMDSDVRTSALALRALLAVKPSHMLGARLAKGLLKDRKGGAWRSTQETAWALLALDDYRRAQEAAVPDFVAHAFVGDHELLSATFKGRSFAQPRAIVPASEVLAAGQAAVAVEMDGTGRLFYEARLRYAKKALPKTGLERGIFVKKTMRTVRAEELKKALKQAPEASARAFRGGDLVLVEVLVVTPSPRSYVVIDDPLPAGFEAVDTKLATTGASLDVDSAEDQGDDEDDDQDAVAAGRAHRSSAFLREVRDDRVLFFVDHMGAGMFRYRYLARATTLGTFIVPPTKAEEMYTPEVFGRTAADTIRISPK